MDRCNSQKQLDSSQRKVDLQFSFCVNMLNLAVKPYPYILYCYIYILTIHQLNIYHCIFCIIGCFLINTDKKNYKVLWLDDMMIYRLYITLI